MKILRKLHGPLRGAVLDWRVSYTYVTVKSFHWPL